MFGNGVFFLILFLKHFSERRVCGDRHHKMLKFHSKVNILLVFISHFAVVLFADNFKALFFVCIEEVPQFNSLFKVRVLFKQVCLSKRRSYLRFLCNLLHKRGGKALVKSLTDSADTVEIRKRLNILNIKVIRHSFVAFIYIINAEIQLLLIKLKVAVHCYIIVGIVRHILHF